MSTLPSKHVPRYADCAMTTIFNKNQTLASVIKGGVSNHHSTGLTIYQISTKITKFDITLGVFYRLQRQSNLPSSSHFSDSPTRPIKVPFYPSLQILSLCTNQHLLFKLKVYLTTSSFLPRSIVVNFVAGRSPSTPSSQL